MTYIFQEIVWQIIQLDLIALGHDHCRTHEIDQLAYVPRPVVCLQQAQDFGGNPEALTTVLTNQEAIEHRLEVTPLAQGRELDQ